MSVKIWIPHPIEAWIPATVILETPMNSIKVKTLKNEELFIPGPLNHYDIVADGSLDDISCDNLVNLENFSEGIILHHIKNNYMSNKIYTFVGHILIAMNPYKRLDIYSITLMESIFLEINKIDSVLPPHVFSIAAMLLQNMKLENKDQCCLISGESGAGKTETTKKLLEFISTMSKSSSRPVSISTKNQPMTVEYQILNSNPILESFGNSKTIRNNNSSRFGKYIEVNFDSSNHVIGCNITAYLLEKTRVVKLSTNERNYHIFYMLVSGASIEQRRDLELKPADQFRYLTQVYYRYRLIIISVYE